MSTDTGRAKTDRVAFLPQPEKPPAVVLRTGGGRRGLDDGWPRRPLLALPNRVPVGNGAGT